MSSYVPTASANTSNRLIARFRLARSSAINCGSSSSLLSPPSLSNRIDAWWAIRVISSIQRESSDHSGGRSLYSPWIEPRNSRSCQRVIRGGFSSLGTVMYATVFACLSSNRHPMSRPSNDAARCRVLTQRRPVAVATRGWSRRGTPKHAEQIVPQRGSKCDTNFNNRKDPGESHVELCLRLQCLAR